MIHLENVPTYISYDAASASPCSLLEGPVERATYNSASCKLRWQLGSRTAEDVFYGANPDNSDIGVANAFLTYYGARFLAESWNDQPITMLTGRDMVLF